MRNTAGIMQQLQPTALELAIKRCSKAFGTVLTFSLAINILMLASPLYMLQVYDRVIPTGHLDTLFLLTLMGGIALLVLGLVDYCRNVVLARVGRWLNAAVSPILFESAMRSRLQGDASGAQPIRDLSQVQSFLGSQGLVVFFDAPWVPVFLILIWLLHPWLGAVALGAAIVLLAISLFNEWVMRKPLAASSKASLKSTLQADLAIRNAEVVQAMGMLPALQERWRAASESGLEANQSAAERSAAIMGFTKFFRFFVQMLILGVGAMLVLEGQLSSGGMVAGSILLGRALAPVEQAMGAWRSFTSAKLAYNRLRDRLRAFPPEQAKTSLPAPVGKLTVENLTFVPPRGDRPVVQGLSFAVEPGEMLAVIGPSAAGKSSLCRLLVGATEPSAGKVRLDGSELRHWDRIELGNYIGYLPQDVELFPGTVRENIARMTEGEDNAVIEAATLANAHEMIQQLPQGYDTPIGDTGSSLSGGQRQRVGLARAVYGDARLVVLDEPNANLDQAGEVALAEAIVNLKRRNVSIVIVGHRVSTVLQADKILVMQNGRMELFGPRDEVLKKLRGTQPEARPGQQPASRPLEVAEGGQDAAAGDGPAARRQQTQG